MGGISSAMKCASNGHRQNIFADSWKPGEQRGTYDVDVTSS